VEKLGATAAGSSRRQLTLRRRRILGQVIALGSVIMLSGWVLLGMPDAQEVMIGVGIANRKSTKRILSPYDSGVPGGRHLASPRASKCRRTEQLGRESKPLGR
jgi:hypothetical protein